MATITDEQLQEWRRLADAVPDMRLRAGRRDGDWIVVFDGVTGVTVSYDIAQFMCAAREAVLILCAGVERLRVALAAVPAPQPDADRDAQRLADATAGARAMQEVCIGTVCYQCACGRELIDGHWHQQGTETLVSCGAWDIRGLDAGAVARRALIDRDRDAQRVDELRRK